MTQDHVAGLRRRHRAAARVHAGERRRRRDRSCCPTSPSATSPTAATTPTTTLIPAFILSELKDAFIIGFIIFIPFLIIDIVVSGALMALGMMMMPPVMVSLPFKLLLFVLVNGWGLIITALVGSYG